MTLLSPGGYSKGDVGRTDTGLGEEHPFSNSVIVHDCVGLFSFFFLFSVLQCGFWMLLHRYTEGRKEYIIFLLTFMLFLVEARITPAVPQLEWPPLSGRDSVPLRVSVQLPFVLWRHSQIMFLMPPVSIIGTITKFRKAVFWSYIY